MRRVLLLSTLVACTAAPTPPIAEVERVILYRDTVNVLMSDGTLCVVDRPGQDARWSGVTAGCPHTLEVGVNREPAVPRRELRRGGTLVIVAGQGWG